MDIYKKIVELKEKNNPFILATVVNSHGSVPGKIGFKMITMPNEKTFGTVGGGAIEQRVIKDSLNRLSSNKSGMEEYLLTDKKDAKKSEKNIIPMSCNGKVWIYYEVFGSNPTVYIWGGGHVGSALIQFLKPLGYYIILIDNREEFTEQNKPFVRVAICEDYEKFTSTFKAIPNSYYVILTHGHKYDYVIAETILKRKIDHTYIGIIASKDKARGIIKKLKETLGKKLDIHKLHTPIGLPIGGNTAEEIALSIAAEIQSVRFNKKVTLDKM